MAFKADKRRNYLIAEDFYPAYATPAQAEEAFRVFDTDNNGYIFINLDRAFINASFFI